MGAIHSKIKNLRIQSGMTQQDVAEKLHLHVNTWQKLESGLTKLDIDRLKEIAAIFEISVEELINTDDGVSFNNVSGTSDSSTNEGSVGIGSEVNQSITNNNCSENERELYERLLKEKEAHFEKFMEEKEAQIALLKGLLDKK